MPRKKVTAADIAGSMIIEKLPGYFLLLCLVVAGYFLFKVLQPFVTTIFVAAVLAVAFYPLYRKLTTVLRFRPLASFVTCLIVILVTAIPITFLIISFANEGVDTYKAINEQINSGVFDQYLDWQNWEFTKQIEGFLQPVFDLTDFSLDSLNLKENIVQWAQSFSSWLVSQTVTLLTAISDFALALVVLLFTLYYFFLDADRIKEKIILISPLPTKYENELFDKIVAMVKAIVFGVFLTALAQGVLAGIGFALVGISNTIFWMVVMSFASLIPMVGVAIIWVPAVIILLVMGNYGAAIFLALWSMLLVGTVDNFLRPFLIGGKARTYPLMTFFVILGGVLTLGFKGLIVGPLVLMVFMSFLHIYEVEYSKVLKN